MRQDAGKCSGWVTATQFSRDLLDRAAGCSLCFRILDLRRGLQHGQSIFNVGRLRLQGRPDLHVRTSVHRVSQFALHDEQLGDFRKIALVLIEQDMIDTAEILLDDPVFDTPASNRSITR